MAFIIIMHMHLMKFQAKPVRELSTYRFFILIANVKTNMELMEQAIFSLSLVDPQNLSPSSERDHHEMHATNLSEISNRSI